MGEQGASGGLFSTEQARDAENIDFGFFAGLVLGLPFSLDSGFVLAGFSLGRFLFLAPCCFHFFFLLFISLVVT